MTRHDELVRRLRERSSFLFPHHGESRSYDADLLHEAADAIEELSVKYEKALQDLLKQSEPPKEG